MSCKSYPYHDLGDETVASASWQVWLRVDPPVSDTPNRTDTLTESSKILNKVRSSRFEIAENFGGLFIVTLGPSRP